MSSDLPTRYQWNLSKPLLEPLQREGDFCFSVKDPTVVRHDGKWHVFCTLRSKERSHQIEYLTFDAWENTSAASRHLLHCREGYFCAPQVFYFRPQNRWYLLYQVGEKDRKLGLQPAFSTTTDISDPDSWTPAQLLFPDADPEGVSGWIDFWILCDENDAYLFFTSLNGHLWRMSTGLAHFPFGFSMAQSVLNEDHPDWRLFEASHTYRVKGSNTYLTLVEGQDKRNGWRRFYLSYVADHLGGKWTPLAASAENPFASAENVIAQDGGIWTDNISHGELLRDGSDETLTVDPANLRLLIQGAMSSQMQGIPYGQIPWRLGLLTPA